MIRTSFEKCKKTESCCRPTDPKSDVSPLENEAVILPGWAPVRSQVEFLQYFPHHYDDYFPPGIFFII